VREPDDEGLIPPVKVLRKRLDGVYRADGLSGPTRRYVLIVAMLVGLASLPTLAAIMAGSNELDEGTTGAMDVPFLPLPSGGPVLPRPSASPPARVPPERPGEGPGGGVRGQAGRRTVKARPAGSREMERFGYAGGRPGGARGGSRDVGVAAPGLASWGS
jgi:hypothetical protein